MLSVFARALFRCSGCFGRCGNGEVVDAVVVNGVTDAATDVNVLAAMTGEVVNDGVVNDGVVNEVDEVNDTDGVNVSSSSFTG